LTRPMDTGIPEFPGKQQLVKGKTSNFRYLTV